MKRKELARKWLWYNLSYYSGICVEGLKKTMKNLDHDNRSPGLGLSPGSTDYEVRLRHLHIYGITRLQDMMST